MIHKESDSLIHKESLSVVNHIHILDTGHVLLLIRSIITFSLFRKQERGRGRKGEREKGGGKVPECNVVF